jgi:hypothetical protein
VRPDNRPHTLRSAELVRRERQHIDAERAYVDRDAASRLDRIGMDDGPGLMRKPRDL